MLPQLSDIEARIIGCLLEKKTTTPEQYPLSRNALTLACNQKSSRQPVMELSESEVQQALEQLISKRLISEQGGGRVSRFQHRFCNTQFSDLQFNAPQTALICVLLLRGAQTLGELKSRSQRLYEFASVAEVEAQLQQLIEHTPAVIKQLPKSAGKRELRYCELFSPVAAQIARETLEPQDLKFYQQRIQELEAKVAALEQQLAQLNH